MTDKPILQDIARLDLSRFERPDITGNRGVVWRAAWYLVNALVFQNAIGGLLPGRLKAALLRVFGARIGAGLVCKPRVTIKYPWFLTIGDHVWIGEGVWIDNLCMVEIGSHVCLSQGVKILTGSHDWNKPTFPFFAVPVTIGNGVWVTAFRVVRPGAAIPPHMAVLQDVGRQKTADAHIAPQSLSS